MLGRLKLSAFTRPVEEQNGDTYIFKDCGDTLLMGVIDGLGHGKKACLASTMAREYVELHSDESLEEIILGCHNHIKKTRGVVLGLAKIDLDLRRLWYAGIGDIEACILTDEHQRPVSRPGIVGYNLRKVSTDGYHLPEGFAVFMHSDGVSRRFDPDKYPLKSDPETAIEVIVEEWGRETDDLTFIVVVEEGGV